MPRRQSEKTTKTVAKLIATRPILYRGRQYKTGEQLPADDAKMVAAWIEYKSAKWEGKEEKKQDPVAPVQPGQGKPDENESGNENPDEESTQEENSEE